MTDFSIMGDLYQEYPEGRFVCNRIPDFKCHGMFEHWNTCYMPALKTRINIECGIQVHEPEEIKHPEHASAYEVTLTTTKDDPYELRTWAKKIANSKMYGVISAPYAVELMKSGMPHIHMLIYSFKKTLDGSKLKTLGFPYRYTFARVRNLDAYFVYINKEKNNPLNIEYCLRKGIPQFDNAIPQEVPTEEENDPKEKTPDNP